MHLARFPRVKLFPAPTPLHRLDNLTRELGGPEHLDQAGRLHRGRHRREQGAETGVADRGSEAQGATHIVTQGAVQSNHVRQTAAVAAMFGMKCTALAGASGRDE